MRKKILVSLLFFVAMCMFVISFSATKVVAGEKNGQQTQLVKNALEKIIATGHESTSENGLIAIGGRGGGGGGRGGGGGG